MLNSVLVVTIDTPFGELIRECLEETGQFTVLVTNNLEDAETFIKESNCSVVFLDPGTYADETLTIGFQLLESRPNLRFVIVAEPDKRSALEIFSPQDYLSKPFYLPDLIGIIYKLFPAMNPHPEEMRTEKQWTSEAPPWLSDVTRAAQHLTRLTLESSAQAALITHNERLWAYAGQLPQSAANELAEVVTRYWDRAESDFIRFVQLASTRAEHMLYATRLAPGMVLALVFDAETPFSTIRSQAGQLVRSLSISPTEEEYMHGEETPLETFSHILSNVPPPDPARQEDTIPRHDFQSLDSTQVTRSSQANWISLSQAKSDPAQDVPTKRWNFTNKQATSQFSKESSPSIMADKITDHFSGVTQETRQHIPVSREDELAVTVKSRAIHKEADPVEGENEEERPRLLQDGARKIILEPVSPSVYNLDYACVLLPRFPHHHLIGDLSEQVGVWVQDICVAFGWRLEHISVRPEFLQWIVNVPPSTSPANLMRTMRRYTSEQIFAYFPRFSRENPSGDFWAPGYLILGGSQPPTAQMIKDFITSTRQRQGITQRINR